MADFGFPPEEVARLIELVQTRSLDELVVEDAERKAVIRGAGYLRQRVVSAPAVVSPGAAAPVAEDADVADEWEAEAPREDEGVAVVAPMVGVFYRSARPDAPLFVEVGDHVTVGQTVGLIEAMKVFSEVPAELAGTVIALPAENGQLVRTGEALVRIKPD